MQSGVARLFPLLGAIALGFACRSDEALAPDGHDIALAKGSAFTAPANLTAAANVRGAIELRWDDRSSQEEGTEIHRSTTPNGTFAVVTTLIVPDVTMGGDLGLPDATRYCYKVRVFRGTGRKRSYTAFSNVACATTLAAPPPPPAAPSGRPVRAARELDQQHDDRRHLDRQLER